MRTVILRLQDAFRFNFERWNMLPARRSRVLRFLYHLWNERFTPAGRYVLTGALATGIAGSFSRYMVGAYAFSIFASLILVAIAMSFLQRPKATAKRRVAQRCVAGTSVPLTITLRNDTKRELTELGACEFRLPETLSLEPGPQYVAGLAPGREHTFTFDLHTQRRGSYTLPGPSVLCAFPFGMMQSRRFCKQTHRLIVYPAFHPITTLHVPAGQRYQPGGLALTSKVGHSMEFIGNREYHAGDRMQDLHHRSWARVGYPVVRQYQEEYLSRVAILADTYLPRRARNEMLEGNLSLAASVADALARREYVVDLFAAGPELYYLQAGRSLAYLDNILDILACIERCPSDPFDVIAPRLSEELRQISTVILLLLSWDERRQQFVQSLHDMGVETKTIVLIDDELGHAPATGPGVQSVTLSQVKAGMESL